jgi:hypothetical protein
VFSYPRLSLLNLSCGRAHFPFLALGAAFALAAAGLVFLPAGLVVAFFLAPFDPAVDLAADDLGAVGFSAGFSVRIAGTRGPAAFFISAGVALWTRVNRVWSPIV